MISECGHEAAERLREETHAHPSWLHHIGYKKLVAMSTFKTSQPSSHITAVALDDGPQRHPGWQTEEAGGWWVIHPRQVCAGCSLRMK